MWGTLYTLRNNWTPLGNNLNILIIDACRDNPLPRASRSSARGLAITSVPSGAKGTAIVYAAGPGQTAQDGAPGENGVFTGALLKYIDQPGWNLERILKATSAKVLKETNNKQASDLEGVAKNCAVYCTQANPLTAEDLAEFEQLHNEYKKAWRSIFEMVVFAAKAARNQELNTMQWLQDQSWDDSSPRKSNIRSLISSASSR